MGFEPPSWPEAREPEDCDPRVSGQVGSMRLRRMLKDISVMSRSPTDGGSSDSPLRAELGSAFQGFALAAPWLASP